MSVTPVKPVEIIMKQIKSKDQYFGSTSLAWLQEKSDYRKVHSEEGNKNVKFEGFLLEIIQLKSILL